MERLALGTWVRLKPRRDCREMGIRIMPTMFASPLLQIRDPRCARWEGPVYWRLSDNWLYERDWFEVVETDPWNL